MKINDILLLNMLILFVSCSSQSENSAGNSDILTEPTSIGKPVTQIDEQLWYVFQDSKNNYWFSSNGKGVFRYDGKKLVNYNTADGLANDTTRQIQEDKLGNIYIITFGGVNKFDGQQITTLQAIKSNDWKLEENDMWFNILGKKNENGPYRFDGKNLYDLDFPKHFLHDEFMTGGINPFFSPYEIYTIYKDRQGAMWFGTSVFGACRFDGKTIKWMYEKDLTIVPAGGSFGIRSIYEDKAGDFWFCNTWHKYRFDFEQTQKSDRLQYQKKTGIGNAQIFDGEAYIYYSHIVEDNNGNIWLTTWDKGIYKYDGENIINYPVNDGTVPVNVVSMYKDRQGNLWLGTLEHGVYKFNGTAFEKFEI